MKQNNKMRLFDQEGREVDIGEIQLYDLDSKGLIRGDNGKLYYQDLNKGRLVQ